MSRFKTELCNNLIELGSCKYGDRCHYAHGAHELRQVSKRHPKYRTEKCKNFELTGKCPFGPRCSYVHPKPDLDSMIEQLTKYLKHTRAPKPDPEDDDDMIINTRTTANDITNTANPISTSALSPNNILQPISITNSSLLQATGDENKENQLVINYQVSNDPLSDHYNDHALALNNSPFIQGTNTSSLTKAFSINSINTTNSTTNSAFTTSSSSNNVSSQAATSSSSILRTPLRNPLSDYLNNTNTILVCVIAGATSLNISNTSRTSINQLNSHYRASFIEFILDASLFELLQTSNTIDKDMAIQYSSDHRSISNFHKQSQTVCAVLSNQLSDSQVKFCQRHYDVLETVLPQVILLTKTECAKITADLRWNCSGIEHLFNRSNQLAFTREAALVRSILNASMMYLVLKKCTDNGHHSCGCLNNQRFIATATGAPSYSSFQDARSSSDEITEEVNSNLNSTPVEPQNFSPSDLTKLNSGSPLRLTRRIIRRQGCLANSAFASAFTKVFIDSEDTKILNKAYRILNSDSSSQRRLSDSDYKDLAYVRWTKSAVNLHNNHIGRQMVREAFRKRCRCHGISGVCQFQTCWDQLLDFDTISFRLRSLYLTGSTKVVVKNSGTFDRPDLYLARHNPGQETYESSPRSMNHSSVGLNNFNSILPDPAESISTAVDSNSIYRVTPKDLIYLYDSPDYCEPQPEIGHPGNRGRACAPPSNLNVTNNTSKKDVMDAGMAGAIEYIGVKQRSLDGAPGSCEQLCCNRGYRSELVLAMVTCNCRFKFCCKVDCEQCLRQRMQHLCL